MEQRLSLQQKLLQKLSPQQIQVIKLLEIPTMQLEQRIKKELEERVNTFKATGKYVEAQRIEQRTNFDMEMLQEIGYCSGIENYSMHMNGRNWGETPYSLLGYFPDDYLINQMEYLIKNEKRKVGDVSVIFCSDAYLLKINEEYLNHSYFTDIITFDYCENSFISGDLFISLERIAENAENFNVSFNKELARVIFHGLLHLAGFNDKTSDEKTEMVAKENFYLKGMDFDKENV